jgi:hypothetical protein
MIVARRPASQLDVMKASGSSGGFLSEAIGRLATIPELPAVTIDCLPRQRSCCIWTQ